MDFVPIGMILPYAGKSSSLRTLERSGWLQCDGSILDVTSFQDLFKVIGYGAGRGTDESQFHLPNLQGMFLRGVDGDGNSDPDKKRREAEYAGGNSGASQDTVLSKQSDAFEAHTHKTDTFWTNGFTITNGGSDWEPPNQVISKESSATGGAETRAKNIYVYYLIYAGPNASARK